MTKFTTQFRDYVCEGDTIECRLTVGKWSTGLRFVATVHRDDDPTLPDERQDGYWPSLDPKSDGYIGPKSQSTLRHHMKRAQATLDAWRNDDWFYRGIAVRAYFDDMPLTGEFDHALWGIEANYPGKSGKVNAYLATVANELLEECACEAIDKLTAIVEAGAEELDPA